MAQTGKFKKKLNLLDLTFLGIGSIIGSGWLYASQKGAVLAGSSAWIAWILGAVAVILIGLVYSEMGAALPRAGGFVRYPDYSHGTLVGYMVGFTSLLAYSSVAGVEVEAVRGYAQYWWPALGMSNGDPTALGTVIQIALLGLFFLLNYWSVNIFGKVNTVITAFKFIVPITTIVVLLTQLKVDNFSQGGQQITGVNGIFSAVATAGIIFAFLGFRQAIDFAGEAKNPQRDVPLAIILSVVVGAVVYVLLQIAFIGAVPDVSHGWASIHFKSPYAGLATALGIGWLANLVLFDAVISPAGTGNIYLSGTARVIFAWAKNGHFYNIFAKLDPKTGVPRSALWLTFIMAILWTLPDQFKVWGGLIGAVTSATVMTYMVGPVSLAAFRRHAPNLHRPFYLKGMQIISPLAFIAATLIIYWSGWAVDSLLIAMTIGSLILYFAFMEGNKTFQGRIKTDIKAGIWLIVYFVFIFIMSRIGSFGPDKNPTLTAPWDTVYVGIGGLILYYWGVASALKKPRFIDEVNPEESG